MFGLVNLKSSRYVFCGCGGSHPFVATNDFTYDNSDGSGPIISNNFDKCEITSDLLLNLLSKYYKNFCGDSYH
ncbi:hypothetical protein QLL95_gp0069 [Cotonvirus japonicus]|uniref:Uncharacterized protein n=1 Tax=Cotonvirus japonicus TaxID=2811091 RepID=A0ABM7NQX3_9VIRU|nr:hypothetical protein QLL95_gp0069 [Cotonvirus japonicus]BCS82558.1 hypothetical protein [Cotonvirus japonicus]